jgi:hypothetical protein
VLTARLPDAAVGAGGRDVELDYKVIMVSDVLSGHAHGLHEATLATSYRIFGDVRPSGEVIELLWTKSPNTPLQPSSGGPA